MKNRSKSIIRRIFLELDYTRIIIMDVIMVVYCIFLCFDCYRKGDPSIGNLALFDAVAVSLTLPVFFVQIFRKKPLGAKALSEEALILERAAKEGDYEKIMNGHDELMAHYDRTVNVIIEFLKDEGIWENDPDDVSRDTEIFDFSPKS